jgi:hypothetical protein
MIATAFTIQNGMFLGPPELGKAPRPRLGLTGFRHPAQQRNGATVQVL